MKTRFLSLVSFAALSIISAAISGCVSSPPPKGEGIYRGPSIEQKQIDRQEAISRQQRKLMQL